MGITTTKNERAIMTMIFIVGRPNADLMLSALK